MNKWKQDVFDEKQSVTFWNGIPTLCRRCIVVIGKADKPTYWYADLEGQEHLAVEITENESGHKFYISNLNYEGWWKVTEGKGSPQYRHRAIFNVEKVVKYE